MTGVSICFSHQREICLEVSEICDIICFPPIVLVKLEIQPYQLTDLHTIFFKLKYDLLIPFR